MTRGSAPRRRPRPQARVRRGGQVLLVPAREVVPGDRIELEAGDRVPADARINEAHALRVDEALLTGESVPVDKSSGAALDPAMPLAARSNVAHAGTLVVAGSSDARS